MSVISQSKLLVSFTMKATADHNKY